MLMTSSILASTAINLRATSSLSMFNLDTPSVPPTLYEFCLLTEPTLRTTCVVGWKLPTRCNGRSSLLLQASLPLAASESASDVSDRVVTLLLADSLRAAG
jgi:hypothetical protein